MIHRLLVALILTRLLAVPALAAELRLTIKGIQSDDGEILIALYNNPEGYVSALANAATRGLMPDSGRLIGTSIRAKVGSQSTVFTQLPPGRYAILVIHDENDHGRLDEDAMGVPTEGYGFGNDARGFLSAPSFDAAAVTIGEADASTSVTLIYPKVESDEDRSDYNEFTGNSQKKLGQ